MSNIHRCELNLSFSALVDLAFVLPALYISCCLTEFISDSIKRTGTGIGHHFHKKIVSTLSLSVQSKQPTLSILMAH